MSMGVEGELVKPLTPGSAPDPAERVTYLVWRLQRELATALDEVLGAAAGLTVTEFGMLSQLARAPDASAADLARRTGLTRQAVSLILRRLERAGLMTRAADGPRPRPLAITEEGRRRLWVAYAAVETFEAELFAPLGEARRVALREELGELISTVTSSAGRRER